MKRKSRLVLFIIFFLFLIFIFCGLYNKLVIRTYIIETEEFGAQIRIALVTDLHSCKYGDKEKELIRAVELQDPDLVILAGDIFDDKLSDENTEFFLEAIGKKYPCYYVTGNHEYWSGKNAFFKKMAILENCGIKRLAGDLEIVTVNGETINICGIDDPDAYLIDYEDQNRENFSDQMIHAAEISQNGNYTILVAHRPELFEAYAEQEFDLVLCGHAHGGQWRIPGLLNGLYAPDQGLFPRYAGGKYQLQDTTMIVSRGLARESTRIPRFYNRPELVIIDLK